MKNFRSPFPSVFLILGTLACCLCWPQSAFSQRLEKSLNGEWEFQREGAEGGWKQVVLPNSFEEHEGVDFDGVGTYRKTIAPIKLPKDARLILHFQAAATYSEVSFDGQLVGNHLGGWTPFRFDVTELVKDTPDKPHLVQVKVDEKVGHNSQGFLPVFAPHFGGIWQGVKLMIVPETWIDDLSILSIGDATSGHVRLEFPLSNSVDFKETRVFVRYRRVGEKQWSEKRAFSAKLNSGKLNVNVPIKDWEIWSPATPNLYELQLRLGQGILEEPVESDWERTAVTTRAAFRTMKVNGDQLLLNEKPISVRGLLNWGYAPPRVAPSIDEEQFRSELELARSYGFNMMKFCLWVPPKRYLEIADEMGMLTWVEYPTWHSKWTPEQLPKLQSEFTEFFHYDRNHPSVVLRSLTCETGPSADLGVIRALYDLCHEMIPGSIVEDDSSWISWNRVHDFYDDHPYGNNHTWVETLSQLRQHIKKNGTKPLVLGESIAADTWTKRKPLLDGLGQDRPFWLPNYLDGNQEWLKRIQHQDGDVDLDRLERESKVYAMLMRKFQIETYRREVPNGGYVVSVIRDFPFASMGMLDFLGNPKWSSEDWNWHSDSMLILKTENDRRSFASDEPLTADLMLSHFGTLDIHDGALLVSVANELTGEILFQQERALKHRSGTLGKIHRVDLPAPKVGQPTRVLVRAVIETGDQTIRNEWPIWIVPSTNQNIRKDGLLHSSVSDEVAEGLLLSLPRFTKAADALSSNAIVVAARFDRELLDFLVVGGRVLLLPDGKKASMPLSQEWFLRGGPYLSNHPLLKVIPRQLLVELQHFDLAGSVVPDIAYLEQIDPILMLWHNHDIDHVKTHGIVFETRIGQGRLLVSALGHGSRTNSSGHWLLDAFFQHLASSHQPKHEFAKTTVLQIREKIGSKKIELANVPWTFKPDDTNVGVEEAWYEPAAKIDDSWKSIKIGQSWEGQGYETLDGWAWYRTSVKVPASWQGQKIYITTEGVDDHYELYVKGKLIASGGDIATKATAFEERKSHEVTKFVSPGQECHIVVRVYDWYGAGGIHRPITIGTTQLGSNVQILK